MPFLCTSVDLCRENCVIFPAPAGEVAPCELAGQFEGDSLIRKSVVSSVDLLSDHVGRLVFMPYSSQSLSPTPLLYYHSVDNRKDVFRNSRRRIERHTDRYERGEP